MPTPFQCSTAPTRNEQSITTDINPFLQNLIFQYTNPLPFEAEPHSIHTIPLLREYRDSYRYYIRYTTYEITPSQTHFQVIFNSVENVNTGIYYITIYPQNIQLTIQDISNNYMNKLIEFNENLDIPLYRPSLLKNLQHKHQYFEVPDIDSKITRQDNLHYWLQQDILQITHFQYNVFQNLTLNDDTIPQIQVFARFLLKFFRFNYQLIWVQQDQSAYTTFPQTFDEVDLLPFIIRDDFNYPRYSNPLQLHIPYFQTIAFDNDFIVELSETSDNRPYTTISTTENHTTPHNTNIQNQDSGELFSDTSESQGQYSQQSPQRTQPLTQQPPNVQFENLSLQPDENHNSDNNQDELQNPNPTLDTQSTDLRVDSNALLVPLRQVEEQDITHHTGQDPQYLIQGSSTLSTTTTTKPQPPITRAYDSPPLPESDTYTSFLTSQQPSFSNNNINGPISNTRPRFTFQSPSTSESTSVTTHPYTQAQNTSDPNIPTTFDINMIHTNPPPNILNSRTLSRPPLQTIPTNPIQITHLLQIYIKHNTLYILENIILKRILQTILYNIIIFQYHQAPQLEPIHILHIYHKFQQTLTVYRQTVHIQIII